MALSTSDVDIRGCQRLQAHLEKIAAAADADALPIVEPLLIRWEERLKEGNSRRALAGLDRHDQPMPTTWRETHPESRWVRLPNGKRFKMLGSQEAGTGPPLAPSRNASRIVANARTGHGRDATGFRAWIAWEAFTTESGLHILALHANPGPGARYPRRDVLGVAPTEVALAQQDLEEWGEALLKYRG